MNSVFAAKTLSFLGFFFVVEWLDESTIKPACGSETQPHVECDRDIIYSVSYFSLCFKKCLRVIASHRNENQYLERACCSDSEYPEYSRHSHVHEVEIGSKTHFMFCLIIFIFHYLINARKHLLFLMIKTRVRALRIPHNFEALIDP